MKYQKVGRIFNRYCATRHGGFFKSVVTEKFSGFRLSQE